MSQPVAIARSRDAHRIHNMLDPNLSRFWIFFRVKASFCYSLLQILPSACSDKRCLKLIKLVLPSQTFFFFAAASPHLQQHSDLRTSVQLHPDIHTLPDCYSAYPFAALLLDDVVDMPMWVTWLLEDLSYPWPFVRSLKALLSIFWLVNDVS